MNALQVMDRYWKEVIQVSTQKNDIKVQYLYNKLTGDRLVNDKSSEVQSELANVSRARADLQVTLPNLRSC